MTLEDKISTFEKLGLFLKQFSSVSFHAHEDLHGLNDKFTGKTKETIHTTEQFNAWFTPEFIRLSFLNLSKALERKNLEKWLDYYPEIPEYDEKPLEIAVIMAGNIPLVGFHDFLCVIMSGNVCRIKLSSKDDKLFSLIKDILIYLNPEFEKKIIIEERTIKNPDAVIATGSNNSSRYFEYYFSKYPHIIRKNRNSAAVLTGEETKDQLQALADDIFSYFGLGCRNISKIFLPENYPVPSLLNNFEHFSYFSNHNKYMNNYDYYRAIHLVNREHFYDMGFLVFKEDRSYSSPVGSLYFEYYQKIELIREKLEQDRDLLQCIVARKDIYHEATDFGSTQSPMLWDYADDMDSLKFLLNLKKK